METSVIASVYTADESTLTKSSNQFSAKDGGITPAKLSESYTTAQEMAQAEINLIELQASASVTPFSQDTIISDTASDTTGYNNTINAGASSSTFDNVNKYYYRHSSLYGSTFYYKMENVNASEGSNLTNNNVVTFEAGILNNASHFNGSNQSLTLAGGFSATHSTALTINVWLNGDDNPAGEESIFEITDTASENGNFIAIYRLADRKIETRGAFGGALKFDITGTTATTNGVWYMVTVRLDGTNARLYVNGVQEGGDTACNTNFSNLTDNIYFGKYHQNNCYFDGLVDDCCLFPIDKGEAWITARYNAGTGSEVPLATLTPTTIVCDSLGTISGTVTAFQLVANCPLRETDDDVTFDITDGATTQSGIALDTKTTSTLAGNPNSFTINLVPKSSGVPTDKYPAVKSYCLKLWK